MKSKMPFEDISKIDLVPTYRKEKSVFKRIVNGTTVYSDALLVKLLMIVCFLVGLIIGKAF